MTELLYQTDSYLKEFDAEVTAVDAELRAIVINQSAFYPGGGGQPNDIGQLTVTGGQVYPVEKVKKQGVDVLHFLGSDLPLPEVGVQVHGQIDWDRRYQLMRTHSAMHVLCGTVFRDYGALVTGGNMEPGKGRMDFEFERLQGELVGEIEAAVNKEVEAGHDIRVKILPRDAGLSDPGFDPYQDQPIAGRHHRSTHGGNRRVGFTGRWRHACQEYI